MTRLCLIPLAPLALLATEVPVGVVAAAPPADNAAVGGSVGGSVDQLPPPRPPVDFVRATGNQLTVAGAPFRFVGANLAVMHGPDNRAGAARLLDEAARDGVRVGRVWAFGEGAATATPWQRDNFYFRAAPKGWIEDGPRQLDRVLAAASRARIRLIITLANSWPDYGGVPQYLRWSGHDRAGVYGATDFFYSDPAARTAYRAHVERLLRRTNTVTGVRYRDDPTILAWELMNESRVDTATGATARRAWIAQMGRMVHDNDPNHLVMSGVSGYRFEHERDDWLAICRLPEVDLCDGHIYPEEMLGDRPVAALDDAIDDFAQLALYVAGKPFVMGELGVRGDATGLWRGQSRAAWIARIFERLRFDGVAGGLLWIYQSPSGAPQSHAVGMTDADAASIRQGMRAAAEQLGEASRAAASPGAANQPTPVERNPRLGAERGLAPLYALRAEVAGPSPVVPVAGPLGPAASPARRVVWDPPAFVRADWEASGFYAGGVLEHVWGTERGYFEYEYEMTGDDTPTKTAPRRLVLRARLSSEYPGTLSPPDGASAFRVSIDGIAWTNATAVRDDGKGAPIVLRTTRPDLVEATARPGRHTLRFAVPAGPHAHGLCIYGKRGATPKPGIAAAAVSLEWDRPGAALP